MYRLILAALVAPLAPAAAQVELAPLYPSPGAYAFNLVDMSNDGRVLVGYEIGPDGWWRSVRWADGVLTVLPGLRDGAQGFYNQARAVSADGQTVLGLWGTGWNTAAQEETLYRWTADTLVTSAGYWIATPFGGSADGTTAVGFGRPHNDRNIDRPMRWVADGPEAEFIGPSSDRYGFAHGASADGAVVAWHTSSFPSSPLVPFQAYRWTGGPSEPLPGMRGYGQGFTLADEYFHLTVSDDGRTTYGMAFTGVVDNPDGSDWGVIATARWRDGAVSVLPFPAGGPSRDLHRCFPTAASADGSVVAGVCHGETAEGDRANYPPVLWRDGGPARFLPDVLESDYGLDLTGWDFDCNDDFYPECAVRALSADGRVLSGLAVHNGILVVYRVGPPPPTLAVNETGDEPDADPADGVCDADASAPGVQCTLRAAIETANAEAGDDRITFDFSEEQARGGVPTIALEGPLPPVTEPVEIDAVAEAPARAAAPRGGRAGRGGRGPNDGRRPR
ncbi:MAG TPA: hypothetical protein VGB53_13745 [Rubricoccaceae bacterium]